MATFTQTQRLLSAKTPLGKDVLLLSAFSGKEEMSRLFQYDLDLLSEKDGIAAKDIVGKGVTWFVQHVDSEPRPFHGIVRRFTAGPRDYRTFRRYRAEVVPWLWFLTRTMNCRIFQNMTAPNIIKKVFDDLGLTDYQLKLTATYAPREYCVQYRETAFNFVSRLMEYEGIFYFFKHEDGKHTLILADAKSAYEDVPETPVTYAAGTLSQNHIATWDHQYEFRSGKWAQTDYNFEFPKAYLGTSTDTLLELPDATKFELFDYPGLYMKKKDGTAEIKIRMEEEETPYDVAVGTSRCCTFTPGGKFTLAEHDVDAENKGYAFTSVTHTAVDTSLGNSSGEATYENTFTCVPDSVPFRPARLTHKPFVQGPQTAVVVGPAGAEIYTDKYGRVKVQFFWDREGKNDENSSCWMRVSQNWAGKNWGIVFHPRIGQEVIVDFLEGDPDRPIITGRVYNADLMPPYELPANQTQSTIKSRSSKQGTPDNFNELRFEDKKDKEEVYFHAERDFNRVVENNDTLKVGFEKKEKGDQTGEIFNNKLLKVGAEGCEDGSMGITVWNSLTLAVGNQKASTGSMDMSVWNSQNVVIGKGEGQAKEGSQTISVYKDRTETVKTGNETVTIEQGNRTVTVNTGNDTHEVKTGTRDVIVQGNDTHEIKQGNRTVNVDMGNDALTVKMGNQTTKINLGKSETEAMQSIELKVGANSIKIDQTGITIKGMMVKIEGQMLTEVKGLITKVEGSAMLQAKGGITMIG